MYRNLLIVLLLFPGVSFADIDKKSSLVLNSTAAPAGQVKLLDSSIATKPKVVKERSADKNKLFRCWQDGQLILAESNWDHLHDVGDVVMKKGHKKMKTYQFGDTFCLYMGGN